MKLSFMSPEHQARFMQALSRYHKIDEHEMDREYAAAFYILSAHDWLWEEVQPYLSEVGIKFDDIREHVDLSSGFDVLVCLAANLFNSSLHADPVEFSRLDERNFELAMQAIRLRCRW